MPKLNFLRLPRKDDIKFRVSHFFFVFGFRIVLLLPKVQVFFGVVERLFGEILNFVITS